MIDLFVAGQLREHGVSLQTLRRVYAKLQHDLHTDHPFCRKELLSDGKTVFTLGMDEQGREELLEALPGRRFSPEILLPFLNRIDYNKVTTLADLADRRNGRG